MKKTLLTLAAFFAIASATFAQSTNTASTTITGGITALQGLTLQAMTSAPNLGYILPSTTKTSFPLSANYVWAASGASEAKVRWTPDQNYYSGATFNFTSPLATTVTLKGEFKFSTDNLNYIAPMQNASFYSSTLSNGGSPSSTGVGYALFTPTSLSNTGYSYSGSVALSLPVGLTISYDPVQ